jgi:hypothetical protein
VNARVFLRIFLFGLSFSPLPALAQTNVLFIGDSLSADRNSGLGRNLNLLTDRFTLKVESFCGFSPDNFTAATSKGKMKSPCGAYTRSEEGLVQANEDGRPFPKIVLPPLPQLMSFRGSSKKADIVVIQLGTNLYDDLIEDQKKGGSRGRRQITEKCRGLMAAVLKNNPDAKILWMAPPKIWSYEYGDPSRKVRISERLSDEMLGAIQLAASRFKGKTKYSVSVIDSRPFTPDYPPHGATVGGDGTHFDRLPEAWIRQTALAIESLAATPTLPEVPQNSPRIDTNRTKVILPSKAGPGDPDPGLAPAGARKTRPAT